MKQKSLTGWLAILAVAAYLGACGNGTTDVSKFVPNDPETQEPDGSIFLTLTSHKDAQVITGSRTITLAGTVTSATEITAATITATLNDGAPVTLDVEEGAFSVDLTLADRDNIIGIVLEFQGESYEATLSLNYPFLAFANGQDAAVVIGQPGFTTRDSNLSATGLRGPWGNPAVANDILYIPDLHNHRVLGYYGVPTTHGAAADFVLGQSDFTSDVSPLDRGGLSGPSSIFVQGETMALVDKHHNRLLIYHSLPTTTGAQPDVVIGQGDFTSTDDACTAEVLDRPESVWLTEDKLFVADAGHNRVLVWDGIPTENGAPADLVLGQATFEACSGGGGANGLNWPSDVWSDGDRVVVVDFSNHRVLIWNTFPTTNGQAADVVLGQEDMDASGWSHTASSFEYPSFLAFNGNQLFVGDCGRRVLIWDTLPEENHAPADRVLGSPDFENPPGGTTQSSLRCGGGVHLHDNQLIVSDYDNRRVMIFEAP